MTTNMVGTVGSTGDIFIVGKMVFEDPVTKLRREECTPSINLSQFIRNIKFPQYMLKNMKTPANKGTKQRAPARIVSQPPQPNRKESDQNSISYGTVIEILPNKINAVNVVDISSTETSPKVSPSRDEEAMQIQRAIAASLEDQKKSSKSDINGNVVASKNYLSAVTEKNLQLC